MVLCTNGNETYFVTEGAYNDIFKCMGFRKTEDANKTEKHVEVIDAVEEADDDDDAFSYLLEKPISQWSKVEVRNFANAKGIDISETKNVSQAKEIIKAYIDGE